MFRKNFCLSAKTLITLLIAFAATPALAQQAGASVDPVTSLGGGLYRITGTALDSKGNAACALALASGRCMFTCGPGSLRCEGGTASLALGKFDLTNLPTETNGTIILQVFVAGNLPLRQPITPGGSARWSAYNDTCCKSSTGVVSPVTYEVTVDGVTKRSVSNSCTSNATFEGFASTTTGTKSYTARVLSSACGNQSGSGTAPMVSNTCYRFQLNIEGGSLVNKFGTVTCPSSADVNTLQEDTEATPMAIFPMLPESNEGAETPAATYQPIQRQP